MGGGFFLTIPHPLFFALFVISLLYPSYKISTNVEFYRVFNQIIMRVFIEERHNVE